MRRQQSDTAGAHAASRAAAAAEHVGRLLALLPLGASVLEPNLQRCPKINIEFRQNEETFRDKNDSFIFKEDIQREK
jgi:hypothetical protein